LIGCLKKPAFMAGFFFAHEPSVYGPARPIAAVVFVQLDQL
jgi:hypothetical protein